MDQAPSSPCKQEPQEGSCNSPSRKLCAVVVVVYLTLVAFVAAAPRIMNRPFDSYTLLRTKQGFKGVVQSIKLSVQELEEQAPSLARVSNSSIPRIIHQSYKSRMLPAEYSQFQPSWPTNHPTWLYQFWTDDDNLKLVSKHFPWFLETYNNLPTKICRADAARYMYMYHYGGLYADLDMESLKPIDPLLQGKDAVLGYMGEPDGFVHNIPNAWMASRPGHPFWLLMLKHIQNNINQKFAEEITGPVALKTCVENLWRPMNGTNGTTLTVLDGQYIYPFDWKRSRGAILKFCSDSFKNNPFFDPVKCKAALPPDSYTVTYWRHGWEFR